MSSGVAEPWPLTMTSTASDGNPDLPENRRVTHSSGQPIMPPLQTNSGRGRGRNTNRGQTPTERQTVPLGNPTRPNGDHLLRIDEAEQPVDQRVTNVEPRSSGDDVQHNAPNDANRQSVNLDNPFVSGQGQHQRSDASESDDDGMSGESNSDEGDTRTNGQ